MESKVIITAWCPGCERETSHRIAENVEHSLECMVCHSIWEQDDDDNDWDTPWGEDE